MLGLIGNASGEIVPDYSQSLQEVYYRATCELLAGPFGGLQSLRGFQYGPSSDKWASWVRDFDREWTQFEYQWNATKWVIDQEFGAGGSSTLSDHEKWFSWPYLPNELPNQLALAVTGRCIGTLETVCAEVCQPTLGLFRSTFKAWLQVAAFDFEAHAAGRRTQTNEQIWRTIVGGVVIQGPEPRRFDPDDMELLDTFVSWVYEDGDVPYAMIATIAIPTASRTYFRSQDQATGCAILLVGLAIKSGCFMGLLCRSSYGLFMWIRVLKRVFLDLRKRTSEIALGPSLVLSLRILSLGLSIISSLGIATTTGSWMAKL